MKPAALESSPRSPVRNPVTKEKLMSADRNAVQPAEPSVFSAADLNREVAEREAAKAADDLRHAQEQEKKQKALLEELHKPFDASADQLMQRAMQLARHAAEHGESEVQVYRFPNSMCSDRGRRINNSEPGWDETLEGRAKLAYEFWHDRLRPLGFHLRAEVLQYPGGMPGDIGLFLTWK
jgi:hypothetical protein